MGETPMNRSPVRRGSSQLAIAVSLLADLAGCGKQEAAPVVRPPAVPVFEPQAVEVKLGKSGGSVTLRTTEAGGFTLEGKAVESGAEVRAENGNVYTLTLVDGEWIVAFNAPGPVSVTLGTSGTTVTITARWRTLRERRHGGGPERQHVHTHAGGRRVVPGVPAQEHGNHRH